MKDKCELVISRREFAQRAAMLSATASLVPAGVMLPSGTGALRQIPDSAPQLSDASAAEAESRYQQILSLYSNRLDEEQRANVKRMCAELQPLLERIRSFTLENGDPPALYLKPIVERAKRPQSATKSQPNAVTKQR